MNPSSSSAVDVEPHAPMPVPGLRRLGAFVLGLFLAAYAAMLLGQDVGWWTLPVFGLAAYLVLAAFVPRLLRFGGPAVAVPAALAALAQTLDIAKGGFEPAELIGIATGCAVLLAGYVAVRLRAARN
jgi:hypothetical protein